MTSTDGEHLDRIRARAHAIWEQEGRPQGRHQLHWRRAKRLVAAEELRAMAAELDADANALPGLKAYFSGVIASGRVRDDLPDGEADAIRRLLAVEEPGALEIITSRDFWPQREDQAGSLAEALRRTRDVPAYDNHGLVHIAQSRDGVSGLVASPVQTQLVDAPLFVKLANAGIEPAAARHLMYAAANRCNRFVTLDDLYRHPTLVTLCPGLLVLPPSALAAEMGNRLPSKASSWTPSSRRGRDAATP
jgi:hypothetical protein